MVLKTTGSLPMSGEETSEEKIFPFSQLEYQVVLLENVIS